MTFSEQDKARVLEFNIGRIREQLLNSRSFQNNKVKQNSKHHLLKLTKYLNILIFTSVINYALALLSPLPES